MGVSSCVSNMKQLILSFSITFFILILISDIHARGVTRWRREDDRTLPEDFECKYCRYCGNSCSSTCGLCSGCDLIAALGLNPAGLVNFGVNVDDCDNFCGDGVQGCVKQCEESSQDCSLCDLC